MSKTKRKAPYPTFGECFAVTAQAIGLRQLSEGFSPNGGDRFPYTEYDPAGSAPEELLRKISSNNCLNDWASEVNGPPQLRDLHAFIAYAIKPFPAEIVEDLNFILQSQWVDIQEYHSAVLGESFAFGDHRASRDWYAHAVSRTALEWLTSLQLQFKRLFKSGPMLEIQLDQLLSKLWTDEAKPLTRQCLEAYIGETEKERTEPKTLARWLEGEHHPAYAVLGKTFKERSDLAEILINFAFARLLENLSEILDGYAPKRGRARFYKSLIHQAQRLKPFYEVKMEPGTSAVEYSNALVAKRNERARLLELFADYDTPEAEHFIPDDLQAAVRFEQDYLSIKHPAGWDDFLQKFDLTFVARAPHMKTLLTIPHELVGKIEDLKKEHPKLSKQFTAPISCVKARLRLTDTKLKPQQRLKTALRYYREAAEGCIYSGGPYTDLIIKEAMGFTAWVYWNALNSGRGKSSDELKPFLDYCYNWLSLLGLSEDFDHPQERQRFELAKQYFIECLSPELREHLETNMKGVEFHRIDFTSAISFHGFESHEKLKSTPINKQRTKPFSKTLTGREQTPLMEAIDRRQFDYAHECVESEEDLNFINSTGDTAVTKAFAAADYQLVLKILRREREPIIRETLLHPTEKLAENALIISVSKGRVDVLQELLEPSIKERKAVDPNSLECLGQTPLYYAVNLLGYWKMKFDDVMRNAEAMMPPTKAMQALLPYMHSMTGRKRELFKAAHDYYRKSANLDGIQACFKFLIAHSVVDIDVKNHNAHTAFTLAIQSRSLDLAEMLLESGADVNHRFDQGGTALCWAIRNQDLDAVTLLLKHGARSDLYVEGMKKHIYELPMPAEIKKHLPNPN